MNRLTTMDEQLANRQITTEEAIAAFAFDLASNDEYLAEDGMITEAACAEIGRYAVWRTIKGLTLDEVAALREAYVDEWGGDHG